MDDLTNLVARNGFLPHGYCFQWAPGVLWTLVLSDLAVAMAYFSVPVVIVRFVRRRPQANLAGLGTLFGLFIFACGVTHLLDVWTIWRPDYELQAGSKLFTAVVSVLTAVVAWRTLPRALAQPSAHELRHALEALRAEAGRRRSAEDHLLEAENGLAATLASIDAAFISTDDQGRVRRMNPVAERITGWTAEEALGQSVWDVFDREGRPPGLRERNPVDVLRDSGLNAATRQSVVCCTRDGGRIPVELSADLTRDSTGAIRGIAIIFRDISRLSQAEAQIRRLAAAVESSADAIVVKDLDGRITDWNPAAERMFGYSAAEAVGQPVQMLIPQERETEESRILSELARGQFVPPFRTVRLARDGRRVEVSVQISPLRDSAGVMIGGVKSARDLTHQRQIEAALRQSEARLRFALESAAIGDWELDVATGQIHRSLRVDLCFGREGEVAPWHLADLLDRVHPEDRPSVQASLDAALDSGQPWHAEFRVSHRDGTVHRLRMDARLARDTQSGDRLVGIVADVTETRHAQQARQQAIWLEAENERVRESNRLKSLFLANMSHELRTPLNAVIGFADVLRLGVVPADSPRHGEYLTHIAQSGRHLLQMINDVLDLSKIEAGKLAFRPDSVDLAELVDEVAGILAPQAAERHLHLVSSIAPDVRHVVLDAARLKQVLFNYLSNAIKFTPAGGRIEVRALAEGPSLWRLEVEDTGIGIEAHDLPNLFVEFHQLDGGLSKRHQGTGLGLALTRRLVEAQGGRVGVYSVPGQGSRFYAVLPRQAPPPDAGDTTPGRLLVGLHSHPVRDALSTALADAGAPADTAATAAEVVLLARKRRYAGLALDMAWPDAPGLHALAEVRTDGPSATAPVKALGMTEGLRHGVVFNVSEVLTKPLRPGELERALGEIQSRLAGRATVLVVDDDPVSRDLMQASLQAAGVHSVAAASGPQALAMLPALQPAAMVLDLMMPGMDGLQVLHALRADPLWARLPVLVWTAMNLSEDDMAVLHRSAQALALKGDGDALQALCRALALAIAGDGDPGQGARA